MDRLRCIKSMMVFTCLVLFVSGCSNGNESALVDIAIEANPLEISMGDKSQISVVGTYADGTSRNVSADITWSDYNTSSSYYIDHNGVLTAYAIEMVDIDVSLDNVMDTLVLRISDSATNPSTSGSGISTFVESPISIDGQISIQKWGLIPAIVSGDRISEQRTSQSINHSNEYSVFIRNDATNLYLFLDVTNDLSDDNPVCTWRTDSETWLCNGVDYFSIFSDFDANGFVSPGIDIKYSLCSEFSSNVPVPSLRPEGLQVVEYPRLSRINYISENSSNGCDSGGKTAGQMAKGFGDTYNSSARHRYYEVSIPLNELCISNDGTTFLMASPDSVTRSRPIRLSNVSGNGCVNADKHIEIKYEGVCNNVFGSRPQIMIASNSHPTFSILATIKTSDRDSTNETKPFFRRYTIPPDSSVDLGCSSSGNTPSSYQKWVSEVTQATWSHEPIEE